MENCRKVSGGSVKWSVSGFSQILVTKLSEVETDTSTRGELTQNREVMPVGIFFGCLYILLVAFQSYFMYLITQNVTFFQPVVTNTVHCINTNIEMQFTEYTVLSNAD